MPGLGAPGMSSSGGHLARSTRGGSGGVESTSGAGAPLDGETEGGFGSSMNGARTLGQPGRGDKTRDRPSFPILRRGRKFPLTSKPNGGHAAALLPLGVAVATTAVVTALSYLLPDAHQATGV